MTRFAVPAEEKRARRLLDALSWLSSIRDASADIVADGNDPSTFRSPRSKTTCAARERVRHVDALLAALGPASEPRYTAAEVEAKIAQVRKEMRATALFAGKVHLLNAMGPARTDEECRLYWQRFQEEFRVR